MFNEMGLKITKQILSKFETPEQKKIKINAICLMFDFSFEEKRKILKQLQDENII